MQTQIRCHRMWHLIRVSTVCRQISHFSLGICKSHSRTYLKLKFGLFQFIVWESLFSIQWVNCHTTLVSLAKCIEPSNPSNTCFRQYAFRAHANCENKAQPAHSNQGLHCLIFYIQSLDIVQHIKVKEMSSSTDHKSSMPDLPLYLS